MIEPQSSEIEYRQSRLMAEAGDRRLTASQVQPEARRANRGHIRRSLSGLVSAVLRNLGVWVLFAVALLVSGCATGQAAAPSAASFPASTPAVEQDSAAPAGPNGPVSQDTGCGAISVTHKPC